jgi:hypothetical protein
MLVGQNKEPDGRLYRAQAPDNGRYNFNQPVWRSAN